MSDNVNLGPAQSQTVIDFSEVLMNQARALIGKRLKFPGQRKYRTLASVEESYTDDFYCSCPAMKFKFDDGSNRLVTPDDTVTVE